VLQRTASSDPNVILNV